MEEALIAFDSTHDALMSEIAARELNVKARLIPTPAKISAGCGLALKLPINDLEIVEEQLKVDRVHAVRAYAINVKNSIKEYDIIEDFQLK